MSLRGAAIHGLLPGEFHHFKESSGERALGAIDIENAGELTQILAAAADGDRAAIDKLNYPLSRFALMARMRVRALRGPCHAIGRRGLCQERPGAAVRMLLLEHVIEC
jgi:hypothetical protein